VPTRQDETEGRIRFTAELVQLHATTLLRLPDQASRELPSRGQVAVQGTVKGCELEAVVEPDGRRGHWLRIDPELLDTSGLQAGDSAEVVLEVSPTWPEPDVPEDLASALAAAPVAVQRTWASITPMARWEWVRWVRATRSPVTRRRRVEVSISKIDHGKRRPCCFDLSSCTDPELAKGGRLPEVP
jgi:Bacteriocin-protection, YdeI or OmpD-Associated/Domain of unknown function (DUF1905)